MKSALEKVSRLLGIHPSVGRMYTGKDRSYARSIYKIIRVISIDSFSEGEKIDLRRRWRLEMSAKEKSLIATQCLGLGGKSFADTAGTDYIFPKKYFFKEYRLATLDEINTTCGIEQAPKTHLEQVEDLLGVNKPIARMNFGPPQPSPNPQIWVTKYSDDSLHCDCSRKKPCTHMSMAKTDSNGDCWELVE